MLKGPKKIICIYQRKFGKEKLFNLPKKKIINMGINFSKIKINNNLH